MYIESLKTDMNLINGESVNVLNIAGDAVSIALRYQANIYQLLSEGKLIIDHLASIRKENYVSASLQESIERIRAALERLP